MMFIHRFEIALSASFFFFFLISLGNGCLNALLGEVVWPIDDVEKQEGPRKRSATQAVEGAGVADVGSGRFGRLLFCAGGALGSRRRRIYHQGTFWLSERCRLDGH